MANKHINKCSTSVTSKMQNKTIISHLTHIAMFKIKNPDCDLVCKTMEKLEKSVPKIYILTLSKFLIDNVG